MSADEWSEGLETPRPKRGVPVWIWGCGGGCLFLIVLLIATGVYVFDRGKKMVDPEIVWANLDEILPYDERPTHIKASGGSIFGGEGYFLIDQRLELMAILVVGGDAEQEEFQRLYDGEAQEGTFGLGAAEPQDPQRVEVQGREVPVVYLDMETPSFPFFDPGEGEASVGDHPILWACLNPGGGAPVLLLQLMAPERDGPAQPEELAQFLDPFDVWRQGHVPAEWKPGDPDELEPPAGDGTEDGTSGASEDEEPSEPTEPTEDGR